MDIRRGIDQDLLQNRPSQVASKGAIEDRDVAAPHL